MRNRDNEPHLISRRQEAPSGAPEGQGESSPGQRSAATAALGNRPPPTTPSFRSPPRPPAGGRGGLRKEGVVGGGRLPRAAVAALLCPGLLSPCPSGAPDGAS